MNIIVQHQGKKIELDEDGFLLDVNSWSVNVAELLAEKEGIKEMGSEHWKLINAIRHYYERVGESPLCRDILKEAGLTKQDMYMLFPLGHRSAYKLAGLPKPPEC